MKQKNRRSIRRSIDLPVLITSFAIITSDRLRHKRRRSERAHMSSAANHPVRFVPHVGYSSDFLGFEESIRFPDIATPPIGDAGQVVSQLIERVTLLAWCVEQQAQRIKDLESLAGHRNVLRERRRRDVRS